MKDTITYKKVSFHDVYCYQWVGFSSIFFDLCIKPFFFEETLSFCVRPKLFFLVMVNEEFGFVLHVSHIFMFQATIYLYKFLFSFVK